MDPFHFFKAKREIKLNIVSGIGIVGQLGMLVVAVFSFVGTQCKVPF
jgi:hypothetical protein